MWTELGTMVTLQPDRLRAVMEQAFVAATFDAAAAAKALGVCRRTFDRWARALGLDEKLAAMRVEAERSGARVVRRGPLPAARPKHVMPPAHLFRLGAPKRLDGALIAGSIDAFTLAAARDAERSSEDE
jgi:hypothetical protein